MMCRDLFGDPIAPPVERRGRPRHVRCAIKAAQIRELHDLGLAHPQIARLVGLSGPTMRMYYAPELGSASRAAQRQRDRDAAAGRGEHNSNRKGSNNG